MANKSILRKNKDSIPLISLICYIYCMNNKRKTFVLAILDGWGYSKKKIGNPIAAAQTPNMDMFSKKYPMVLLQASGLAVGMTWGESGNSEVGHLNIGAGRIVEQYLSRINRDIQDNSFFQNSALVDSIAHAKKNNSKLHLIGLLTSGTAHADFSHILALLDLASRNDLKNVSMHLFLDGKDSGLNEAPELLLKLKDGIRNYGYENIITTLAGRNYAMDRDNNWDLTKEAYELISEGKGSVDSDFISLISANYSRGLNDSNMKPIVADHDFKGIKDADSLVFFNFREDSMRQIIRPFVEDGFSLFKSKQFNDLYVCTMTEYLRGSRSHVAFLPPSVPNNLAEVLQLNGKTQLHIAETEKYAHVTYFFNGLRDGELVGEVDVFIDSNKDHKSAPEMKSAEIANRVIDYLESSLYDFIVLNLANADMLAHTGSYDVTLAGVEAVDRALGRIFSKLIEKEAILIVTADHGNAESLVYRGSGEEETRHDDSPVPLYLIGREYEIEKSNSRITEETSSVAGILGDVAPTILELMGIPKPPDMTGKSLIELLVKN